jgi:hypothetical protein
MISPQYIKANYEGGIYILLLAISAHVEHEFRTVQNLFVGE